MYEILARLVLVVGLLHLFGFLFIVGPDRLRRVREEWTGRLRSIVPALVVLVGALAVNNYVRQIGPDISWMVGVEITDTLYQLEGEFVLWLQSFATTPLTTYFSYIYVYGYVFLLLFPLLAYFSHEDMVPLRILVWSYLFNYVIGLVCYLFIIAYGPRNVLPDLVEPLLYSTFPEYQYLTREVNRNTNVFPSLHTSLSVTALLLAVRTRDAFPRWLPIAAILSLSVVVSTMYLGIHWASDVVAGIVLAGLSVSLARRVVERSSGRRRFLSQILSARDT